MKEFPKKGAEADVRLDKLFGEKVVVKERGQKKYRINELDEQIRKSRTKAEARILLKAAEKEIIVPHVKQVGKFEIVMTYLEGELLRDLNEIDSETYQKTGELLASIHQAGIAHGDFTPANVMIHNGNVSAIDFGLAVFSEDAEEQAIDLMLMKRSVGEKFKDFIEGYKKYNKWELVLSRLEEIEKRGRYQERSE